MFLQKYLLYVVHFYDFRYLWGHKKSKKNNLKYDYSMNLITCFFVFYNFSNSESKYFTNSSDCFSLPTKGDTSVSVSIFII